MELEWNPQTHEDYDALRGRVVYTADNRRLGKIMHVFHPMADMPEARGGRYFLIEPDSERSPVGSEEVFVPERVVRSADPDEDVVVLEVPASELADQNWNRPSDFDRYRRT